MTMPDYQIDPHLRHDFSPPPPPPLSSLPPSPRSSFDPPPPWSSRPSSSRRWLRFRWSSLRQRLRRLRWWLFLVQYRAGSWIVSRLSAPFRHDQQAMALQLLILALLLIVLLQALLLILFKSR